ncbi:MAG: NADH-quinone oxidoreductase subunit NuoF, partial [Bacteroidota bacterium]|nr:NADH-quinone oxidoreductase subunit NuoF [Bacteroidota bacterium]
LANGSMNVYEELKNKAELKGLDIKIELDKHDDNDKSFIHLTGSGCQGFCAEGPLLTILPENILYTKVRVTDVEEIINETLLNNRIITRLLYENPVTHERNKGTDEIPFYKLQKRLVLGECGLIDPENIKEYISHGGYQGAYKAYTSMSDIEVCDTILESGLRGRGGGGFPTGKKWHFCREEKSDKKYIICNGDEGDPGAFMDRSLMEGNPHRVLEGMMIAARGFGGNEGHVYVRMEYPLAVKRMKKAIKDAEEFGILGKNIFGSGYDFTVHVMEGAGAFVCGEETALMSSIEGKRGMPKPKPPFPAHKGLWGKPTVINNVETLAAVPLIIKNGPKWFNQFGTENSKGTKTFALTGHVANTGLIEVPFGTTLREIVYNIGGGVTNEKGEISSEGFKAVQMGGPSGGCLTSKELDLPLDYDNLIKAGAMVGSGGMVVMNHKTCMVKIAQYFMKFTQSESCGKCVPCREGTKQILSLLEDIIEGRGTMETLNLLEEVAGVVKKASLCGLGKTAPSPVLSTLEKFRDEYLEHIDKKRCKTNQCKALANIYIDAEKCIGCTACARKCPVEAIKGEKKKAHVINSDICTKCGTCATVCKFGAIVGF